MTPEQISRAREEFAAIAFWLAIIPAGLAQWRNSLMGVPVFIAAFILVFCVLCINAGGGER